MVATSGVKKAIFNRLCKQLEEIGQRVHSEYSLPYFKTVRGSGNLLAEVQYFQTCEVAAF